MDEDLVDAIALKRFVFFSQRSGPDQDKKSFVASTVLGLNLSQYSKVLSRLWLAWLLAPTTLSGDGDVEPFSIY